MLVLNNLLIYVIPWKIAEKIDFMHFYCNHKKTSFRTFKCNSRSNNLVLFQVFTLFLAHDHYWNNKNSFKSLSFARDQTISVLFEAFILLLAHVHWPLVGDSANCTSFGQTFDIFSCRCRQKVENLLKFRSKVLQLIFWIFHSG